MFARLSSAFVALFLVTSAVVASNNVCEKYNLCCDNVYGNVSRGIVYYCAKLTFAWPGPERLSRDELWTHQSCGEVSLRVGLEAVVLRKFCASRYIPTTVNACNDIVWPAIPQHVYERLGSRCTKSDWDLLAEGHRSRAPLVLTVVVPPLT